MSYFDDLKKKGQNFVQSAGNAVNKAANNLVQTVQNTGNAANNAVRNVYNTAVQGANNVKSAIDQGARNVQNAATGQPTNDDTAWVEEYNQFNAENSAPTTVPTAATTPTAESTTASTNANAGASASTTPQDVTQNPHWQEELNGIMKQILNREKFSYDMNGDAMYQQYADIYQNQANMAMQNAMAQNAALTGGYGSSYGQMVGQQAYAQQMQGLNEIGMDLYDRAYQQYMNEGDQLAQQYSMLADREGELYNRAYQKGRDEVGDNQWQTSLDYQKERDKADDEYRDATLKQDQDQFDALYGEEGYYNSQADKEYERMYGDLKYDENGNIIGGGYYTQQNAADNKYRDESLKQEQDQFDALYGEEGYYNKQADTEYERMYGEEGYYTKKDKQEQDQFDALYGEEGYYTKKDKQSQENWQAEFDREGELYDYTKEANNPNTTYEGEGALNGQEVPKQLANVPGLTTMNTKYFDENGEFISAAVVEGSALTDKDGNSVAPEAGKGTMTYNIGGKQVKVQTGTNPYTNTVNPEAKDGVFENGYQPTHYNGNEVTLEDGRYAVVNGQEVDVYSTVDANGKPINVAYDAVNNQYIEIDSADVEATRSTNPITAGFSKGDNMISHQYM